MTEDQIQEYKQLKAAEEYREWMRQSQRDYQEKLEAQFKKDTEANIEYMRDNGTLTMGRM